MILSKEMSFTARLTLKKETKDLGSNGSDKELKIKQLLRHYKLIKIETISYHDFEIGNAL